MLMIVGLRVHRVLHASSQRSSTSLATGPSHWQIFSEKISHSNRRVAMQIPQRSYSVCIARLRFLLLATSVTENEFQGDTRPRCCFSRGRTRVARHLRPRYAPPHAPTSHANHPALSPTPLVCAARPRPAEYECQYRVQGTAPPRTAGSSPNFLLIPYERVSCGDTRESPHS